jgi:hypothetical protein
VPPLVVTIKASLAAATARMAQGLRLLAWQAAMLVER